jgi:glycosyltransferase involved in cell wall biosynthesis
VPLRFVPPIRRLEWSRCIAVFRLKPTSNARGWHDNRPAADERPVFPTTHPSTQRPQPRTLADATILQIVPSLRDEPAARTAVETAIGLMQSGGRTLVAGAPGPLAGKLQTAGGEWIPFVNDTMNPLKLRRNARMLEKLIAAERIDVIHAHGAGAAWSALWASVHSPVRLVTSLPDAPPPADWIRSYFASALTRADRIIASSSYSAKRMIERFDIAPERVAVIPRSLDTRLFDPAAIDNRRLAAFRAATGIHRNERIILVPGRITAAKGHHVLVEAAAILAARGLRRCVYVLAGDDRSDRSYARRLQARINKLGLQPVFRTASVFRDMPAALAASHLVVLPAVESPTTGRAVAAAQAMARPVITTELGLLPEYVLAPPRMPDELRTGWLMRPGDPEELAGAIGLAMRLDQTAYQALAARARQFAHFMFSPESVVSATRTVYTGLIARDR